MLGTRRFAALFLLCCLFFGFESTVFQQQSSAATSSEIAAQQDAETPEVANQGTQGTQGSLSVNTNQASPLVAGGAGLTALVLAAVLVWRWRASLDRWAATAVPGQRQAA